MCRWRRCRLKNSVLLTLAIACRRRNVCRVGKMNLCKKVTGKKVSEKKPGNKNFGKKVPIFRTKRHWK